MAIGIPKQYTESEPEYNPSITRPGYRAPANLPEGGTMGEEKVMWTITGPTLVRVQALATFEMTARNEAKEIVHINLNILEAELTEDRTGDTTKGLIHPTGKGTFNLQFRGRNAGKYHFNVWVKGQLEKKTIFPGEGVPVEFTPHEIVVTRNMYFSASGFGLVGGSLGRSYGFNVEVKDDDQIPVDCDVYKLTVQISQGLKKISGQVDRLGVGKYKASFTPFGPGEMVVSLIYGGEPVIQTTVTWDLSIDPGHTEVINPPGHVLVGHQHTFTIQARADNGQDLNVGGEKFDVAVSGPSGGTQGLVVRDERTGKYVVRFTLTKPGTYKFFISLSGADIIGSPLEIEAR